MPVLRDWDLALDADKVLWGQGADPAVIRARRPKLAEVAERAIEEGRPLLAPAVAFERFPVQELRHGRLLLGDPCRSADGPAAPVAPHARVLAGPLIAEQLSGAEEVVVAVCSVGDELAKYASEQFQGDFTRGLALDGLASAAAEALAEAMCRHIEEMVAAEGLQTSTPLNPGMIGWPLLEGQQQIFALVDTQEIGVSLGESGLMSPLKSVSFALGVGRDMNRAGRSCDYCTMRELCRYRDRAH